LSWGSLQKYFSKRKGQFSEENIKILLKQLLSAISYLSNLGIVHRDLKLDNIVYMKNPD